MKTEQTLVNKIMVNELNQAILKKQISDLEARLIALENEAADLECESIELDESEPLENKSHYDVEQEFYIDLDQAANGNTMH